MVGYIVRHRQLGIGKVISTLNRALQIRFIGSGQVLSLSPGELRGGSLSRENLGLGSRCRTATGMCTVKRITQRPSTPGDPFAYEVVYEDGTTTVVSETDLVPLPEQRSADPLLRLAGLEVQEYALFRSREELATAYTRLLRNGAGLRALLASRVDLRPHQAFVAGTVILDRDRRYILADEVGLGKTIEAGIVIHDLLAQKPDARILVICPGALTQQWLSELYSKFGGQLFTLLDLHSPLFIRWPELRKVIVSTTLAGYQLAKQLEAIPWDMVVIDEAHHLLASPVLYDLACRLSRQVRSILLLSAIPAHEREDELLRLLALLEPQKYEQVDSRARERFAALYQVQSQLGRGLRVVTRRLESFEQGELTTMDVVAAASRLLDTPIVAEDFALRARLTGIDPTVEFAAQIRQLLHDVADRYRLSRRILRNRRQRLIEQAQIAPITRQVRLIPYQPDQLELEAFEAMEELLGAARDSGLAPELLAALVRVVTQGAILPSTACDFLARLKQASAGPVNDRGRDLITIGHTVGYTDWELYRELLFRVVRGHVPTALLGRALQRSTVWQQSREMPRRWTALLALLHEKAKLTPRPKLLVFVGFPGAAAAVALKLREYFGPEAITEFRADLELEVKERNVARFHHDAGVWILVSDETGGEGRNFQFASELVHFDNPWHVARIEQRIGRLDRLGREHVRADVLSNVLYCEAALEAGLIHCYSDGLAVYTESLSGLEFALRDVERALIAKATNGGREALIEYATQLREIARREREQDDSEAVLDEASFERAAAARYRTVVPSDRSDRALENAFVTYFRALSGRHGVHEMHDIAPASGVWRFRPEETRYGALPVDERSKQVLVGNIDGTFRRDVAQQQPSLQFFSIGNPFFDAVIRSLSAHPTGRVYAVECVTPEREPWVGFEFVFLAEPNYRMLENYPGLVNRASETIATQPVRLFYSAEGTLAEEGEVLTSLRRCLDQAQQGRTWWDLSPMAAILPDAISGNDWQETLTALREAAQLEARARFATALHDRIAAECARLDKARWQPAASDSRTEDDTTSLRSLQAAVTDYCVVLEAVGFLSINGELRRHARR